MYSHLLNALLVCVPSWLMGGRQNAVMARVEVVLQAEGAAIRIGKGAAQLVMVEVAD